uniref:Integrase catalytic domain-containing protein n=1 Tax=Tanacetum cinerariifolium TaxID=118510 RepID=A0A699GSG9_TANCI|nr:hypothetical protein [Tanacetum cinerariifolium]
MNQFCRMKGIKREFSNARTPQQNKVAVRKNKTLIEAARTMLAGLLLPIPFWAEAVNTACYVQNKVLVTKPHNKTPYELLTGRPPIISFMRPFGYPVTILNTLDHLGKFNGKANEGFLVGYSLNRKAFRVYNSRTQKVEENLHVNFLENKPNVVGSGPKWLFDIDSLTNSMNYQSVSVGNRTNGIADVPSSNEEVESSPKDDARKKSIVEATCVEGGKIDDLGCLDQRIKSIDDFKNTNNKVYKVEKALYGLHQAPRAWYETISNYFLENGFRRRIIDKTLFIKKIKNDILLVQVYIDDIIFGSTKRSLSIEFERLMHNRFQMSSMWGTHFLFKTEVSTPMETHKPLSKDPDGTDVDVHLYRSMIGSLMCLTSSRPDIMFVVCACSRFQVQPKVSHMHAVKRIFRDLKGHPTLGLWYHKDSPLELIAYSDSDYVGASLDRKSTTGVCQFLGSRIISWQCKKQTIMVNSTTEEEYIAASSCCGQVLWLQNQLFDYGYNFM